jgi:hypothetical protein
MVNLAIQETDFCFSQKTVCFGAVLEFSKPVGFERFAISFCILNTTITTIAYGTFECLLTTGVTFHDYADEILTFLRMDDWSRLHDEERRTFY